MLFAGLMRILRAPLKTFIGRMVFMLTPRYSICFTAAQGYEAAWGGLIPALFYCLAPIAISRLLLLFWCSFFILYDYFVHVPINCSF